MLKGCHRCRIVHSSGQYLVKVAEECDVGRMAVCRMSMFESWCETVIIHDKMRFYSFFFFISSFEGSTFLIVSGEEAGQHLIMKEALMQHLIVLFYIPLVTSHNGHR
jgi:hypothetical protein